MAPGSLALHEHGVWGIDVMRAGPEELAAMGLYLATQAGCTWTTPTPVTASVAETEAVCASVGRVPFGCNGIRYLDLEGPFIGAGGQRNGAGNGAVGGHDRSQLRPPSVEEFNRYWGAAQGRIRLVTLDPEYDGAMAMIAPLEKLGVRPVLGHTACTYRTALDFIQASCVLGVRHAPNSLSTCHRPP